MMIWKIAETLSEPNDPEWDLLVQSSLGGEAHPDRKRGFLLAREALYKCCLEAGHPLTKAQLRLRNYSLLEALPQFTVSLSHTPHAGAGIIADRRNFQSVGIDIEHEERLVKDPIAARIAHPEDEKLRNIELWCLKEAMFKAIMNTGKFERPIEFSSIKVGSRSWSHPPSKLEGEWEIDLVRQLVVARAFLRN